MKAGRRPPDDAETSAGGPYKNSSVTDGRPIIARVCRAEALTRFWIDADSVYQTYVPAPTRLVTLRIQHSLQACRKVLFHQNHIRHPLVMEARRIDGCLRVHSQAHPV